ncbi:hypothetical protein BDR07DRAFT_1491549 [Suillus spraguei]|nr:hypothetical protein BDR07DRAFT_1491549 [Suillus spraguei]
MAAPIKRENRCYHHYPQLYDDLLRASLSNLNDTNILAFDASDSPSCGNPRTLWDILLNCGLTLIACTWNAIHPDIPDEDQGIIVITFDRWTLTHGFFACMGGFVLYVDGEPRTTLTPDELLQFAREGSVDIPEADIKDRSEGDMLSKCVAVLQLVWFITQFAARLAQHLPVTLLEIDTWVWLS